MPCSRSPRRSAGVVVDELPAARLLDTSLEGCIEASALIGLDVVFIDDRQRDLVASGDLDARRLVEWAEVAARLLPPERKPPRRGRARRIARLAREGDPLAGWASRWPAPATCCPPRRQTS